MATGVPYFDLSLQHVSRPLLARMRRWGDGERFLRRIADIRRLDGQATFRSSFILGYPGETERDHDRLLEFLAEAPARLGRVLPLLPRSGDPRGRSARSGAGRTGPRAPARVRRAAGRDHGGPARPAGRRAAPGAGGRPGPGAYGPRGTGDRRHRAPARRHRGRRPARRRDRRRRRGRTSTLSGSATPPRRHLAGAPR